MVTPEPETGAGVEARSERPSYLYPPVGGDGDAVVLESMQPVNDRASLHTVDVEQLPETAEPWRPRPADGQRAEDMALREVIGQALGTASMCWANVAGAGEFDSVRAAWVRDGLIAHLDEALAGIGGLDRI